MIISALVFALFIIAVIVAANTDSLPFALKRLYRFPGGDKVGHFILFGILSFLLNKSALILLPRRDSARVILTVSLLLAILVGLEEWSQSLFPARTASLADLFTSYAGVFVFALLAYRTRR